MYTYWYFLLEFSFLFLCWKEHTYFVNNCSYQLKLFIHVVIYMLDICRLQKKHGTTRKLWWLFSEWWILSSIFLYCLCCVEHLLNLLWPFLIVDQEKVFFRWSCYPKYMVCFFMVCFTTSETSPTPRWWSIRWLSIL